MVKFIIMSVGTLCMNFMPFDIVIPEKSLTLQTELPTSLARQYKRDAARITLRMAADKEDLRFQPILIPKDKINSIYFVLANIWQKDAIAKSIADCNVHTFPNPSIDNFIVIYKRDVDWAEPLRQGLSETNSPEINRLLTTFNLSIDKHVQWNETLDAITIRSKEPINVAALANEFSNISGVTDIDQSIPRVQGNDIKLYRISGGWEVEYILRFGAYAGDPKVHTWRFKALDNGGVVFLKEGGDPIPAWMRCEKNEDDPLAIKG